METKTKDYLIAGLTIAMLALGSLAWSFYDSALKKSAQKSVLVTGCPHDDWRVNVTVGAKFLNGSIEAHSGLVPLGFDAAGFRNDTLSAFGIERIQVRISGLECVSTSGKTTSFV